MLLEQPEKLHDQEARRYQRHKEKRKAEARDWYHKNRVRVLARMSTDEGRKASRDRMRERMKDPHLRLHSNISRAIRSSLKDKYRRKWEGLVGYSLADLTAHIEKQFVRDMTWDNHGMGAGRWNVDHITPRSMFSFTSADDPEFRACWALSNLRPMWALENISKHANRTHLL